MSALEQIDDAPVLENVVELNRKEEYAPCPECKGERTLPLIVAGHVGYETCQLCRGWGDTREVQ
jgi:hypothetical protein